MLKVYQLCFLLSYQFPRNRRLISKKEKKTRSRLFFPTCPSVTQALDTEILRSALVPPKHIHTNNRPKLMQKDIAVVQFSHAHIARTLTFPSTNCSNSNKSIDCRADRQPRSVRQGLNVVRVGLPK